MAKLDRKTGHWTVTGIIPQKPDPNDPQRFFYGPDIPIDEMALRCEAVVYYTPLLPLPTSPGKYRRGWGPEAASWQCLLTRCYNGLDKSDKTFSPKKSWYEKGVEAPALRSQVIKYVSLQAFTNKDAYILQRTNQRGLALGFPLKAAAEEARMDATFALVQGLASPDGVSFRSVGLPSWYLVHDVHAPGRTQWLHPTDDEPTFRQNATFRQVKGLADEQGASFESVRYPHHYLRARGSSLLIDPSDGSEQFRADATFFLVAPLSPP
jgi:hypothetical protein